MRTAWIGALSLALPLAYSVISNHHHRIKIRVNALPLSHASMSTETGPQKKAIIVGAGPVGCLTALSLANRGWRVEVWEGRPGPCPSL